MTETETRFKSLVQPIKDLASNWDIDIAESLNDYLDELEHLRISLDGGKTQLNFAEAALLIQGSTAVYSKKVEYLHQLVLRSLEFLTNKKSNILSAQSKDGGRVSLGEVSSSGDDDLLIFGNDPSFLLLDNYIEMGVNIDLKPAANANYNSDLRNRASNESGRNSTSNANNVSKVSISLMHSLLNDDHGTASLKLASSFMDSNGALMLGGFRPSFAKPSLSLDRSLANVSAIGNMSADDANHSHFMQQDEPFDAGNDWVGDEDVGGGNDHYDAGDYPAYEAETEAALPARQITPTKPNNHASKYVPFPQAKTFVMLDPHVVVNGSRPVRRGRPYRIPTALKTASSTQDSEKIILDNLDKMKDSWKDFLSASIPLRGVSDCCLLPLLKLKRKLHRKKREVAAHNAVDQYAYYGGGVLNTTRPLWEENNELDHHNHDMAAPAFHDDYDMGGGQDDHQQEMEIFYGGNDDHDAEYDVGLQEEGGALGSDEFLEEEELARRVDAALNEDLHRNNGQSYEMICKQYIESFHRGANAFVRESQLSKRVTDWTLKLEPILQAQEEAAPFDIHEYSDSVLVKLDHAVHEHLQSKPKNKQKAVDQEKVSFSEVVQGSSSAEVCRSFLACLQLANLGNVFVESNIDQQGRMLGNDFQVRLLVNQRPHVVETFLAPSAKGWSQLSQPDAEEQHYAERRRQQIMTL